nr:immunoglobulin heavy chain junction region [Macaca mulatta]MPN83807.1 immunoglobulin heavy chain junction region [Macaca mulatta]
CTRETGGGWNDGSYYW